MDCRTVKSESVAYQSGNLTGGAAEDIGKHLADCADCATDARNAASTLSLLKTLDDITPNANVWLNVQREVGRTAPVLSRRSGLIHGLLRFAAAASVLVAAISFIFVASVTRPSHAATVSVVAPDGTDLLPGRRIMTGETFHASTYVVLAIPDIGLLKLNRDTDVCFESPTRVRLTRGELFAEVTRGFVVESADAVVTVNGTRFGVRAGDAASTVYVVEGKVEIASRAGRTQIESGRMTTVGGSVGDLSDDRLEWMAPHERIMLNLVPGQGATLRQGDSPTWRFSLRTNSAAPLTFEPAAELPSHFYLRVINPDGKEYTPRLGATVTPVSVKTTSNGAVRLDVMTPVVLSYRVDPALFPSAGRYTVTLAYQGRQGALQSDPLTVEVR